MGRKSVLAAAQRRALARLSALPIAQQLYLAGGTAVALHLDHRRSLDLDFFSRGDNLDLERARREITDAGARVEVIAQSDATLHLRLEGADVDIVRYRYPLLEPPSPIEGVTVAGLRDLAAMKLAAIAKRGLRRDFWDIHEMLTSQAVSPREVFDDYRTKFQTSEADTYHVLRALVWFEDAEGEPVMPRGLTARRWRRIRAYFETNIGAWVGP